MIAAQALFVIVLLMLAVVVGRGGDVGHLAALAAAGALGLSSEPLGIEDVVVTRRQTRGPDAVVVRGVVVNRASQPFERVGVEVTIAGATLRGVVGDAPDPLTAAAATTADDLARLLAAGSWHTALAAGARAPFVVVAPAPRDGTPLTVAARQLVEAR